MSLEERIGEGPYVCAKYLYTPVPCGGSCLWVFDYLNIKKFEKKKNKLLHKKN